MRRSQSKRTTSLWAAAVYLLAIALSSVSHVHVHALADGGHEECATACATLCGSATHDHDHDHDAAEDVAHDEQGVHDEYASHEPAETPAHDDDCNICQFLGRPLLAVTPFAVAETSEHVVPLPAARVPVVRPIVVVVTHARAPPHVAPVV
jgi:hypothetical protein